jgi:DNA-directed RNA polymerase subunit RPC12/RpoP
MTINEEKMKMVIENYFKDECDINTTIHDAFEKGFRIGVKKVISERKTGYWVWDKNGMDFGLGAWCCSECKSKAETWWASDKKYNPLNCSGGAFCGNCGAKMIKKELDSDIDCEDCNVWELQKNGIHAMCPKHAIWDYCEKDYDKLYEKL